MTPSRYLVRVEDRVIGPHALATLQQMASVQAFDENAWITPEGMEQWTVVKDSPELRACLFPGRRKFQFKDKAFTAVNQPNREPITVEQMLRGNLAQAKPHEASVIIETPAPNRRRRDFVLALALCYAAIGILVWILPHTPIVVIPALGLAVIFSLGVYWVLYHVMSKY
jgi:hypothetical protein